MRLICKRLAPALLALLCLLSLASCKAILRPGENGLHDKQSGVDYYHASTVYEATGRGKEYGTVVIGNVDTDTLYVIPGIDPDTMLATADNNILYASTVTLPTLPEMKPTAAHICVDGATMAHQLQTITDEEQIAALIAAYMNPVSPEYPSITPIKNYRLRFESPDHPAFYFTVTYLEYAEDIEIDGVSYGKYFFYNAFEDHFVPAGDIIHIAMNGDTAETAAN